MYRNILVPLDGSAFGEYALPLALAVARRAGGAVQLVHVHPTVALDYLEGPVYVNEALEQHARETEKAYLEQTARKLRALAPVEVTTRLLLGNPAEAIEEATRDWPADLVVLTTHGRGMLGRFWLGSTADVLVRRLAIPILLTRPEEGSPDLSRPVALKRMVVALDGAPWAENMLLPAMELGRALELDFVLARVIQRPTPYVFPLEGGTIGQMTEGAIRHIDELQERLREDAENYLLGIADRFRMSGLKATTRVLVADQPAAALLAEASRKGQDMIALETHGRGGLARVLLGSVADKVVRGAQVPVLLHRPT